MPVANIVILAGHPRPVLKQLVIEAAQVFGRCIDAPVERLQVWITEVDPELYAVNGSTADEVMTHQPRGQVEIPLIRMALLEGRPVDRMHLAIREMSAVVARHLGGDPARVRVQIDLVSPERWGIGGQPASVVRAAEIAQRAAAQAADRKA